MAAPYHLNDFCAECQPKVIAVIEWLSLPSPQPVEESTTTPEDTLRAAGISSRRQARYPRRMSSLLAGRE